MTKTSETLVTVFSAGLMHEIHIAKSLLARHGIPSFIFDEHLKTIIGTAIVEGYKLKVNSKFFKQAREILMEMEHDEE